MTVLARLACLVMPALTLASVASAQGPPCKIGRFDATASIFHLDADGDGLFSPDGTGNRSIPIDVTWPGVPLVGDWNGDGFDDVGKQVGTWYRVDLDGDGVWEGNAGGDRNLDFAPSFGPGIPLVGDWNGDGKDEIGTYVADGYQLLLDRNGNGTWDDVAGGDAHVVIQDDVDLLPGLTTLPLVGDWNGDGADAVGLTTGSGRLYLDLNGNHQWDGAAGGDFAGVRGFMQLVGDWNGDGRDDNGRFLSDVFLVDFYDDHGASTGGGEDFPFAKQFTPGTPLVCDWDGDGTTNLGKVVADRFLLDLNANGSWDGNALGDRNAPFAAAPDGPPLAGRWAP